VFKTADAGLVYCEAAAVGLPVQAFSRPVTIDNMTLDARFRTTRLDRTGLRWAASISTSI